MFSKTLKYFWLIVLSFQFALIAQTREVVAYYPEWGVEHNYYAKDMDKNRFCR